MKNLSLVLLALLNAKFNFSNAEEPWNYKKNGDDWPLKYPNCSGPTQSPIDLPALGGNTNITTTSYSNDKFLKQYQNPLNA
jgi:hypothetical protein